jgi:hypothetical protein
MPIPLAVLNDYVRCIERQKAELWKQLDPLLTSQIHIGERKFGRPVWTDTTHREITRLKAAIAEYEGILASIKFEKYRYEPVSRPKSEKPLARPRDIRRAE